MKNKKWKWKIQPLKIGKEGFNKFKLGLWIEMNKSDRIESNKKFYNTQNNVLRRKKWKYLNEMKSSCGKLQ